MLKKKVFLIGNAHLDPVWMWRWQEGSAEAKATIRSALDRMNEYPDFRFVCSSASVYRWVEDFAPEMFEEIRQRVKEGRFIIVGGWFVQPDCNQPSGEGFARQGLYAQRYFMEKFGVTAKVGYNVDSFGHNAMLPQILKKSGMNRYIFMRPGEHEKKMPSNLFNWTAPDGSTVLTCRIQDPYCFNFDTVEKMEERLNYIDSVMPDKSECQLFFYGVGNHGGGPTIKNIETIKAYAEKHPERELVFADPAMFFDAVSAEKLELPEHRDDLQHHASGCYSAVHMIKDRNRQCETALTAAEGFSVLAGALTAKPYPALKLREAWLNTLFNQFHDSLGGCCIKDAYDDAELFAGEALCIAAKTQNSALQTISWAADTSDASKGIPVFIFNPHPWSVKAPVTVNKQVSSVRDLSGRAIPFQHVNSQTHSCTGRSDSLFEVRVPGLGYTVYYIETGNDNPEQFISRVSAEKNVLENDRLKVTFEEHSGYIMSIYDKQQDRELLDGFGAVPVVIDEFYHDTWSHAKNFFDRELARFGDAELSVVESGPVRACIKVVSRYNSSVLTQYFSLRSGSKALEVRAAADWREKHKMLKLAYQLSLSNPRAFYEIPFGVIERPCDGEEEPGLMWTAVCGDEGRVALLNKTTNSSSVKGSTAYLTILRSPVYGDHGGPRDSESMYTQQGCVDFSYTVLPLYSEGWSEAIKASRLLNLPLTNIIENNHKGKIPLSASSIGCSCENVVISAVKRAEDGTGTVIRAYETDGKSAHALIELPLLNSRLEAVFEPHSVKTFMLDDCSRQWREVLLTEYDPS